MISSKHVLPFLFFFIALIVANPVNADAQDTELFRIETTDGNVFIGEIRSENDREVIILTESVGEITISRENIRSITKIDESNIRNGRYWHENPHATRYLFAPNALGLKKGQGYYQNTWIFFNNVDYGISNNISIGGGLVPVFLFGAASTPFWITPKVSIPVSRDNLHIAGGAIIGGIFGEDTGGGGIFYGTSTIGHSDKNLSVGLGYGFGGGDISDTPVINISGSIRVAESLYLLSENYLFPGTEISGLGSFGARWAPGNVAVDFALVRPLEGTASFIGVPWLSVAIPFGQ